MALSFFDKEVGGVNKLWVSNGTVAGTHVVGSLGSGAIASDLTIGSQVFFSVSDSANGSELWKSDGTAAGTVLVKGISPELNSSLTDLTNVGGALYFAANDQLNGQQLWKSDGTAAG